MRLKKLVPLSLAGSLAMLTACQLGGLPTNTGAGSDVTVGANTQGKVNVLKPGEVQTNPNLANPKAQPNATVQGVLLDTAGMPVAGALVSTLGGQTAVTDAQGRYTIQVAAEAGKEVVLIFQKEGFVYSSDRVTMNPGETADLTSDVKKMDGKVNMVTAAGGTFANATGVLEIDVPAGALTGDTEMILTPLSYGANGQPNELPGPLETVDENGNRNLLMPIEYWSIDMKGGELKAGESISMRMQIPDNPDAAVKLKAGDLIPCYIYDAEQGYWNSPNLGPIVEKDGKLWATYEIKASSLTDRVNPAVRTVQQAGDPDPLPNGHYLKNKVVRINCGGVDEDGNRTSRNLPVNGSSCNEDELAHNAWVERNQGGAATNFLGTRVRGISGGHTWFNEYGTNVVVMAKDHDGTPITGLSASFSGGSNPGQATLAQGGAYGRLQYRKQRVDVKVSAPSSGVKRLLGSVTLNDLFTGDNPQPVPRNQFGRNILYENTVTVNRGSQKNGSDRIQSGPVSELLAVKQGSTVFKIGKDCLLDIENRISWAPDAPERPATAAASADDPKEPAAGSAYTIRYHYPDPNMTVQGREPEKLDYVANFDSRHALVVNLSQPVVDATKLKFTLNGQALTGARTAQQLKTTKLLTRGTKYTLIVAGDGSTGSKEFTVPTNKTWAEDFVIDDLELKIEAK